MVLQVVNPATGETVTDFDEMEGQTVRHRIRQADDAFRQWRRTDIAERARLFREASVILESEKANFASLMALEMGKPIRDGRAEIDKCVWACRHFAEKAPEMLANEMVPASTGIGTARNIPLRYIPLTVDILSIRHGLITGGSLSLRCRNP
jgi:succinate-semialdehyde dehydrogenase/glutarate-semialdehyde dehydrogenase